MSFKYISFFFKILFDLEKNKQIKFDIKTAIGTLILLSPNIELLNIPEKYCVIEMCENLKWILPDPIKILFSLRILINGKWYNPASGLFTLDKQINKNDKNETIRILNNIFLIIFLFFEIEWMLKINKENKNIWFTKLLSGKKKFKFKANIDIKIELIIPFS